MNGPFEVDYVRPTISGVTEPAKEAGLSVGDTIEALNGVPYRGELWQRIRWYAHIGDRIDVTVRKPDGGRATIAVPTAGYSKGASANKALNNTDAGEAIFVVFLQIVVPLFCLLLGYWVAVARPHDLNAWLILVLLNYPQAYISASTYNWLPGTWLALRLGWHIVLEILAPGALAWLGLLFPERSRIDIKLPWLKWAILGVLVFALAVGETTDYCSWYEQGLIQNWPALDAFNDRLLNWTITFCLVLYWIAIFDKLRTASPGDSRRRLRVLCAGSVIGLGSILVVWGLLPWFGIADPGNIQWLGYLSAILMLAFPLSVAYVVIVQRAMDVRILVRMGTRYALARTTLVILQVAVAVLIITHFIVPVLERRQGQVTNLILPVIAIAAIIWLLAMRRSPGERIRKWLDRKYFREAYDAELVLGELADKARTITDPATLIDTVTRRISEVLHIQQIAVLLRSGSMFRLQHALGLSLDIPVMLAEDSSAVRQLKQTNAPAVLYRAAAEEQLSGYDGHRLLGEMNTDILLPLPGRSRLMGMIALGAKQSEEPYTPSDLRLLHSVGIQTGLALEVSELAQSLANETAQRARSDRELEIAHEVQQRLFPQRYPVIPGLSLAGHCRPAQGVGGDYYDLIELEDGRLGFAIGDVSGKGVSAALIMAGIRSCLRTMTLDGSMDLAELMRKMNRLVYEASAVNRYATFFFAVYDPAACKLTYVNAGHNPPVLLRKPGNDGRERKLLDVGGTVVGLLPDVSYEEQAVALQPGDLLLAYTDGISEAMTENDEEWGEERMTQAAEAGCDKSAEQILRTIFDAADAFTGSAPQHDDMTLLVAKFG